jgi:antitoxin MazE
MASAAGTRERFSSDFNAIAGSSAFILRFERDGIGSPAGRSRRVRVDTLSTRIDRCGQNPGLYCEGAMRVQVKKWGNSASVRIPTSVMAAASLSLDQAVDVREEGGRIIIEPIRTPSYDLDRLLDGMTPETFHEDEDFGPPAGNEAW